MSIYNQADYPLQPKQPPKLPGADKPIRTMLGALVGWLRDIGSKLDLTFSQGVSLSFSPGIFSFNGQLGLSIDTDGNLAIQGSYGGGLAMGAGLSLAHYVSITNAPSIEVNSTDYHMIISDDDTGKYYYGVTASAGPGVGAEAHVTWGGTYTFAKFNVFDALEQIFEVRHTW